MEKSAVALKKILLMDPDYRSRELSSLWLSFMNLEVLAASSIGEALDHLEKGNPHLVLMDWPFPGWENASLLRAKLISASLPVIFCNTTLDGSENVPTPDMKLRAIVSKRDRGAQASNIMRFLSSNRESLRESETTRKSAKARRQILVIEDSPTLRGIIRRTLEKAFPEDVIREAEEGRQAISEMAQKKVDLIVTDLEMPGMDGLTFLNLLKGNQLLSKKPVLIFSGKITEELRSQAAFLPNVRFLSKPADPEKIVAEVTALLNT